MPSGEGPYELTSEFRNAKRDLDRELHGDLQKELDSINRDFPPGHSQRAVKIEDACCGHLSRTENKYREELLELAPLEESRRRQLLPRAINKAFEEIATLARQGGGLEAVEAHRDWLIQSAAAQNRIRSSQAEAEAPTPDQPDDSREGPNDPVRLETGVTGQFAAHASPVVATKECVASRVVLNVSLISTWMDEEGWSNETLAKRLQISERTVSSLRNNGRYHGMDAITKLANLMGRDPNELYLHEASS